MIVPRFWAEASVKFSLAGKRVTIRRFGWSDSSQQEAQGMANSRADEAMADFQAGKTVGRREPKVAYNGAEGVPIREEIVNTVGDTVITRNLYGARCLNTPDVLFADIDYYLHPSMLLWMVTTLILFALLIGILRLTSISLALGIPLGILISMLMGNFVVYGLQGLILKIQGGPEKEALGRIRAFLASHIDWNLRVYRTPAGLRILALHNIFDTRDKIVQEFFAYVGADPIYQQMCLNQRCFRARVSPKPWRIGMEGHIMPRPGVWPVKEDKIPQRKKWVDRYEQLATNYSACEFLEEIGCGVVHPKCGLVLSLHDQLCGIGSHLPLA